MASTFSQTLRLELIGDGDQSGIWGQTTNTNLGTLLEQAITGVVSITMVDANYTLTNFNGVSDEARNAVLVVGGTNAAVRDIIAPLVEKLYVVKNSTVGGFGVRIIGSSGTGVTVPNGATVWVYCDGTNFNAVGTETVGNFEVNGNLAVTGNETVSGNIAVTGTTTLTGAITLNGATTLSNTLTYGGTTLANSVTGTGSMALSASPTFTGTPAAPTASPGTNTTQIATTAFVLANGVPSGAIMMWSGSIASIPSGWLLCNGANGTPDLRDRFIVGAGSTYAVGATGGAVSNTLSTAQLPSHTHSISASGTTSTADINHTHYFAAQTGGQSADHTHASPKNAAPNGGGAGICFAGAASGNSPGYDTTGTSNDHSHAVSGNTGYMNQSVNHDHTVTVTGTSGATGSGSSIENRPPYYALAYIMKA